MINAKEFIAALEEIEQTKGISKQSIIDSLKEAMEKAYRKQLGASEDALVRVDIDPIKASIAMYQLKNVVEEVEDDFLEVSLEEIKNLGLSLKVGEVYQIEASADDLKKSAAINVKNILRQKLAEAEKAALYEVYKDKIGEMITGVVEKIEERYALVNIGGANSVYLPASHRIPGEVFKVGDRIKLYVVDVVSTTKGAQISVSRSDAGFLKRLFEDEIHEIYEGTVIIKNIAREAGERSKVAVYSTDTNIDPAGACIGPNGSRIQKIVSQLGNGKDKEKIDIITYSDIPGIFIMESLKPAHVVGIMADEKKKVATAVVANGQLSLAIGKRGVNARLAVKLTGWNIDIKEQDEALTLGIKFLSAEELRREAADKKRQDEQQAYIDSIQATPKDIIPEVVSSGNGETAPAAEVVETPVVKPAVVEPKPAPAPIIKTVIRTTKTLEDLEKELEREKAREVTKPSIFKKKVYKKPEYTRSESVVKEKPVATPSLTPTAYMPLAADEEPEAEEEKTEVEEEVDFDEFDEFYEEKE